MQVIKRNQRLNNAFTILTIGIMSIVMYIYFKYIENEKKVVTVACQKDVVCFDKVYDKKLLHEMYLMSKDGKYTIQSGFVPSIHMKSKLTPIIDLKLLDQEIQRSFAVQKPSERYMQIHYEIIENDKLDPNKKSNSANCKNYAGYILASFKLSGVTAYKIQIDFLRYDMQEIEQRLQCIMESFYENATL